MLANCIYMESSKLRKCISAKLFEAFKGLIYSEGHSTRNRIKVLLK